MMTNKFFCSLIFFSLIAPSWAPSKSGADFRFYDGNAFNPVIASPAAFLGYELGDRYTPHHRVIEYVEMLAKKSGRVRLETYGETNEGRRLILLTISSEENLSRLDEIRNNLAALRTPAEWKNAAQISGIVDSSPAIFWLSYNVHGNEPSSSEAALQVAYQLAAGEDENTKTLLRDLVILIDPMLNPDGRERYVNWFTSVSGRMNVVDAQSREHQEPWPGGRTNHYYFDLNRDWAWLTQIESQSRMKAYRTWYPQGFVDFHEMGYNSSYFFFPAHGPIHSIFPSQTAEWGKIYGAGNAAAFDARGWLYYTEEDFDLFYPGYGDSWPSLNGAIGMTYEQAGHGDAGVRIERHDGTILSLRERIAHHFVASMATLETTQKNRRRRLEDFHRFWKSGYETAANNPVQTYVVRPGRDAEKTAKAMQLLIDQGVEVWQTNEELNTRGAASYANGTTGDVKFPAGSFLIHTQQAASYLVAALFDRHPAILDTFFYDITAWSFPAAHALETFTLSRRPQVAAKQLDAAPRATPRLERRARYAYLLPWEQDGAPASLFQLMEKRYRAYASQKPFTLSGGDYARGTIVIPVAENGEPDSLMAMLQRLATRFHVRFIPVDGGQTEKGIDLGSSNMRYLKPPQIAVLADENVDDNSFGAIWFLFDHQLDRAFSTLSCAQLKSASLKKYSVIIFPNSWSSYDAKIDSVTAARLKNWVQEGGVLIGVQGGAAYLASEATKLGSVRIKKDADGNVDDKEKKAKEVEAKRRRSRMTLEEKEKEGLRHEISGAIMKLQIDNTHPLGFGLPDTIYALKTAKAVFDLTDKAHNVAIYARSPKFAGFLSAKNAEWIGDTAGLTTERIGRGRLILFADDPNFRHFWPSMIRLFINAVVFGSLE